MKVGEYPKMPYPQCGRSIKAEARGNNDAPSITKYGSPIRLDAQIVALRLHCARAALKAPPMHTPLHLLVGGSGGLCTHLYICWLGVQSFIVCTAHSATPKILLHH